MDPKAKPYADWVHGPTPPHRHARKPFHPDWQMASIVPPDCPRNVMLTYLGPMGTGLAIAVNGLT